MKITISNLEAGKIITLPEEQTPNLPSFNKGERWIDIDRADPDELRKFLEELNLHPLQITRCIDSVSSPGVITFGMTSLMEYPTAFETGSDEPGYLSILINETNLVTIRHGKTPELDNFFNDLKTEKNALIDHLPQIVYLILDRFADLNIDAQTRIRDQINEMSRNLADNPKSFSARDLSQIRWDLDKLISLIENQLYCVSGLNASDNKVLQESHRKAYMQDLVSEAEIAQRGVYRLETRLNALYNDFQLAGSDLVEKRLRFLTIVSAITLPLGLIAGLLGMNVGGVPGLNFKLGFQIVVGIMVIIVVLQYWYFKKRGWFD